VSFSDPNPPYWSCGFIHANGGTVLNDAYDECTLNSPETREALQWIVDLTFEHKVAPILVQEDGADDPFVTGKVAYYFGGTWNESAIRSSGIDWDFLPMPSHPETGKRSVQNGSNAWSILSTSANPDAA
jgi:multiple sugar transport system substrate-binding protein